MKKVGQSLKKWDSSIFYIKNRDCPWTVGYGVEINIFLLIRVRLSGVVATVHHDKTVFRYPDLKWERHTEKKWVSDESVGNYAALCRCLSFCMVRWGVTLIEWNKNRQKILSLPTQREESHTKETSNQNGGTLCMQVTSFADFATLGLLGRAGEVVAQGRLVVMVAKPS